MRKNQLGFSESIFFVAALITLSLTISSLNCALGQDYPLKSIRLITTETGGGSDFIARLIAQGLTTRLSQQVIVDNRPSGLIPGQVVAKSSPDGYTLLLYGGTFWLGPLFQKDVPYDVIKDFSPVTLAVTSPNILVVHPSIPANSVRELIALAKAKPGALNYSSSGTGSSPHLASELLKSMAGINIVRINYKATSTALNDLIGGQVQLSFVPPNAVLPQIRSGKLRALAVTSLQPSQLFPNLPTVASTLPGYELTSMWGIFAPASTPTTIIRQLNQQTLSYLGTSEARERFLNNGIEVVGSSPDELKAKIQSDILKIQKLIKESNILS